MHGFGAAFLTVWFCGFCVAAALVTGTVAAIACVAAFLVATYLFVNACFGSEVPIAMMR